MLCPECNSKTRVTNSRSSETATNWNRELLKAVKLFAEWHTSSWVARTRVCRSCDWQGTTIELDLNTFHKGWKRRK